MTGKKIEEVLIARGLIRGPQLEMALKSQLILGGHVGTCLLELGLIDEVALGGALAETYGVPHAPSEVLEEIPDATIGIVTAKVAEEYGVIPFRLAEGTLHMAMIDPGNLPVLDALSFATEKRIVPWVSPELRIFQALERYYGIPRRSRYITICHALDRGSEEERRRAAARAVRRAEEAAARGAEKGAAGEGIETAQGAASASADEAAIGGDAQDLSIEGFDYGKNWHEVAAELHLDDDAPPREAAASKPDPAPPATSRTPSDPSTDPSSLDDVAERLCRADGKDEIADAVLGYARARMPRCMLLSVQKGTATVWLARGLAIDPKRNIGIPITSGIFDLLLGNELYRGPLPKEAAYGGFYSVLGFGPPAEVLLIPIQLSDRLVAIFYGDGGPQGRIAGESESYLRLCRLLGLSMKLLILKSQMRKTAHPPAQVRVIRRALHKSTR